MSKKIETLEKKAREAKTGNGFVSAIQKYLAEGGSPDTLEEIVNAASFSLSTGHLLSILFFHAFAKRGINQFSDSMCERITKSADFNQKISLASIISEFKDKDLGEKISEEAFSEIEGSNEYYFYALSGLTDVVLNTSIESVDGNGSAPLSVGSKDYKISTIQSILDDIIAAKDSFSPEDYASNLIKIARCYYLAGDAEMGDGIYRDAIAAIQDENEINVIFYEVGDILIPGSSVFEPMEEVSFPSETVREDLITLAKKKMKGDDLDNAMSYFS